jgi:NarL family two-component system response regulator LiaR
LRKTRILVVEDHQLIRRNMCCLVAAQPDFDLIDEAENGTEAIRKADELKPDVVLLDISIPEPNGLRALPRIKKLVPKVKILIVTNHDEQMFVEEALRAGADGFLSKTQIWTHLVPSIRQILAGEILVSARPASETDSGPPSSKVSSSPAEA